MSLKRYLASDNVSVMMEEKIEPVVKALSNPAGAQNVSYMGICSKDICPKSYVI